MRAANNARLHALVGGALFLFLVVASHAGKPPSEIRSLALSPDGKLLAIDYGTGDTSFIYKVPINTGRATRLTNASDGEEAMPTFSPDGKQIAYTYWPDHKRPRIVIVDIDGSSPREWPPSEVADVSPVFSPDGKTIVFSRFGYFGSYSPIAQPHPHEWDFFASGFDGTNVRQLTSERFYKASAPSVSPDGKCLLIAAEGVETKEHLAIYSLDHAGLPLRTFQPHVPKEADHKNPILAYPNYLPDGTVLFMAASNGKHGFDYDVYRLNLETGTIEQLTNEIGYATALTVSAEGKTAAFLKWQKNWLGNLAGYQLYLLDIESHKLSPLSITGLP